MRIKDILYKLKIIFQLFANMKYRYRVEIEDYHPDTWSADVFHLAFFHTFEKAQHFIKTYDKPFYLIRLFEQDDHSKMGFTLCNIESGETAGVEIEQTFEYITDEFGYDDIPINLSAGWYLRGENAHHPMWVRVTKDLGRIEKEVLHRYITRTDPFYSLKGAVRDVFRERHPNAPQHFKGNFYRHLTIKMSQALEANAKRKGQ